MLAATTSPNEYCEDGWPPTLHSTPVTTRATRADAETVVSVTLSAADGALPERPPRCTVVLPGCFPAIRSELALSTSATLVSATTNVTSGVASKPSAYATARVRWYGYAVAPLAEHEVIDSPPLAPKRLRVLSSSNSDVACGVYVSNDAVAVSPPYTTTTDAPEMLDD